MSSILLGILLILCSFSLSFSITWFYFAWDQDEVDYGFYYLQQKQNQDGKLFSYIVTTDGIVPQETHFIPPEGTIVKEYGYKPWKNGMYWTNFISKHYEIITPKDKRYEDAASKAVKIEPEE